MAIKVKAVERYLKFDKESEGEYRYVLSADLYSRLSEEKVIEEAALRSGMSKGTMHAAWAAIGDVVKSWATEGHSVAIPGLGTMRFALRAKSVTDVDDVASSLIRTRRVQFSPSSDIKKQLAATAINITCFDRNGKLVKRVSSYDAGDIEEDEGDSTDMPGGGTTPGGSGNSGAAA